MPDSPDFLLMRTDHWSDLFTRPGTPAAEGRRMLHAKVDVFEPLRGSSWHHGGHFIGFDPHAAPRIRLTSMDAFELGDVFTLEPGVYGDLLQGGIRLEQNYRVAKDGIERLTQYPLKCPLTLLLIPPNWFRWD